MSGMYTEIVVTRKCVQKSTGPISTPICSYPLNTASFAHICIFGRRKNSASQNFMKLLIVVFSQGIIDYWHCIEVYQRECISNPFHNP